MLVSPAEPLYLRELGTVSSTPEKYGADFLFITEHHGLVGVQRKELSDLVASLSDDRISRELIQMKELDIGIWLIEGTPQWSSDGQSMWTRVNYTRSRHLGFLFMVNSLGFWLVYTDTIAESGLLLLALEKWLRKETHHSGSSGGGPKGEFGEASDREWQAYFLSRLPGLGVERAQRVLEHYGRMPLALTGELSDVPGVGKKTAERIRRLFNGTSELQ